MLISSQQPSSKIINQQYQNHFLAANQQIDHIQAAILCQQVTGVYLGSRNYSQANQVTQVSAVINPLWNCYTTNSVQHINFRPSMDHLEYPAKLS
jgi:hypothetical protein